MNKITIELCTEDRARIDSLFEELVNVRRLLAGGKEIEAPKTEAPKAAEPVKQEEAPKVEYTAPKIIPGPPKAAEEPKPTAAPEPTPTAREVTVAEIQAKVVELVNAGKKAETREIILKYAERVGSIPEDKRAEVLELLTGLEG